MNDLEHLVVHGCINISMGFFLLSLNMDPILHSIGPQNASAEHMLCELPLKSRNHCLFPIRKRRLKSG
jgi:hypothetical protein